MLEAPADALPFPGRQFDRILSVHTVYFWSDAEAVFRELLRVARPGARLVLGFHEPDPATAAQRFPAPIYHFRGTEALLALARSAGWRNVEAARQALPHHTLVWLTAEA